MEITVEMVERLREKAPVSYAQAKEALEYSEGNLLDALIYLEEKGAIPQAEGTRWSGREEKESQPTAAELVVQETPEPGKKKKHRSPLGVVVVWQLLPIGALTAYIGIIYFNECLNFALSAARLHRAVKKYDLPAPADPVDPVCVRLLCDHSPAADRAVLRVPLPLFRPRAGAGQHQRRDGERGQHRRRHGAPGNG